MTEAIWVAIIGAAAGLGAAAIGLLKKDDKKDEPTNSIAINQPGENFSNNQIAIGNTYNGITATDATHMALQIFREYYPKLKQEAIENLEVLVKEELSKTSPENIIPPKARIVVPTLQGASISDEQCIRGLYAKLLAGTMDKGRAESVHPAFVKLIDEMDTMDAKVLKKICDINNSIPVARITFTFDNQYLTHVMPHFYSTYFEGVGDEYAVSKSIENLSRLNLINLFEGSVNNFEYKNFENAPYVQERFKFAVLNNPGRDLKIKIADYVIQENDFGCQFAKLCILD